MQKVKTKNKPMGQQFAVIKPIAEIRLDKLKASQEAMKAAKELTISLKDFIKQNYHGHTDETAHPPLVLTIRDIGIAPFEIDIYDNRIIVVEVTGKTRKDFNRNEVPERIYKGRSYSITSALQDIGYYIAKRKLQSMDSSVVTLRDYYNAYAAYNKYLATTVMPEYAKALDAMQDKLPFTKISVDDTDEEDWFKK